MMKLTLLPSTPSESVVDIATVAWHVKHWIDRIRVIEW